MIENIRKGENKLDFSKFVFVDQWKMKVRIGDLTKIRTGKLDANAASMDGQYPFFTCSKDGSSMNEYSLSSNWDKALFFTGQVGYKDYVYLEVNGVLPEN